MNKSKEEKIIHDHLTLGLPFRSLVLKYGLSYGRTYRIVKSHKLTFKERPVQEELPDDAALLKVIHSKI